MLKKIKRADCLTKYPDFPQTNSYKDEFFYPITAADYVLTLPSKSTRGNASGLARELVKIASTLRCDSLVFLGGSKQPWLCQENNYAPAKRALQYLADNKVSKRFNGALEVYTTQLSEFIPHLFWLVRCNAALPDVYFMDADHTFLGTICRYGNLHLEVLNKQSIETIKAAIAQASFEYTDSSHCGSNSINGRQIIV